MRQKQEKGLFWVFTNLRDAAFVAPVQSKRASKTIKQKKRPQQNKLHFSTEGFLFCFFLKHHVQRNDHEIALISDVVKESSSLFGKKKKEKKVGFGVQLRGCGLQRRDRTLGKRSKAVPGCQNKTGAFLTLLKPSAAAITLTGTIHFCQIFANIHNLKVCFISLANS